MEGSYDLPQFMKYLGSSQKSAVNYTEKKFGSSNIDRMIGLGQINRFFA